MRQIGQRYGLAAIYLYALRIIKPVHPTMFLFKLFIGILPINYCFWKYPIRIIDHRAVVFVCGELLAALFTLTYIQLICYYTKWAECKFPSNRQHKTAKIIMSTIVCFVALGTIVLGLFIQSNPKQFSWFDGNGKYTCYNIKAANKNLLGVWDEEEDGKGIITLRFIPDCPFFSKSKQYTWIIQPDGSYECQD